MDIVSVFDIPFKGLSEGEHKYDFELDDRFFEHLDTCGIMGGNVRAEVVLRKSTTVMTLRFLMEGTVRTECDRCLEICTLPVEYEGGFTVRTGSEAEDFDGEIMWLDQKESTLNVGNYMYESIVLSLPVKRVHAVESECDPQVASQLSAEPESEETDPRWEKLRELREKMNNTTE